VPKILIAEPDDFSPEVITHLRKYAEVDVRAVAQREVRQALQDYDVFWFRLGWPIDAEVLNEKSRCRILATPVTGIDHIDEELCARLGVKIACLRGERAFLRSVRATAELTLGLAIAVMRHLPAAANDVNGGRWFRDDFRGHELYERTAGVVGCGRLGNIVAGYLLALGMRVFTYDPRPEAEVPAGVTRLPDLASVLRKSDLVTLHVNYHAGTHNMIGPDQLAACKPGATLVNTSRGGLIDEAALLAALTSGHLAAAALDVVADERGFGPNHPLAVYAREHRNLLLSPHIGGNTFESFRRTEAFIAEKVIGLLRGCGIISYSGENE
jgi:D-3-phosphoglycerate dehydrogenase